VLRAIPGDAAAAEDGSPSAFARITVYRPALATWFGPGFYGQRTACGEVLTSHTLGVANRTLPCGTKVDLYYRGRTVTVPVIDRGPYSAADYDLTGATAQALHFDGEATIGANPV
jgi:rare lipoprotein A